MYLSAVYKFVLDPGATEAKWKSLQPPLWMLFAGFGLCAVAWFWSLFSSFRILHESRRKSASLSGTSRIAAARRASPWPARAARQPH